MREELKATGNETAGNLSEGRRLTSEAHRLAFGRWIGTSVLLVFFALLAIGLQRQIISEGRVDGAAPDFELTTYDGETIRLADLRGKGIVLNFWASWCLPCRTEAPLLEAAWRRERDNDVVFIGLAYLDQEPAAKAFLAEFDITYPNGPDLQSATARRYRITGVPETFFIGPDGQISGRILGPILNAGDLEERLDAIRPTE